MWSYIWLPCDLSKKCMVARKYWAWGAAEYSTLFAAPPLFGKWSFGETNKWFHRQASGMWSQLWAYICYRNNNAHGVTNPFHFEEDAAFGSDSNIQLSARIGIFGKDVDYLKMGTKIALLTPQCIILDVFYCL